MRKLRASIYPNQVENAIVFNLNKEGRPLTYAEIRSKIEHLFVINISGEIFAPLQNLVDQGLIRCLNEDRRLKYELVK